MSFPRKSQPNLDPVRQADRRRRTHRDWKRQAKLAREPFYALPLAFLSLLNDDKVAPEAMGLLVYCMLKANEAGEVKESMAAIARHFGVDTSTISRRFRKLADAGRVEVLQLREGDASRAFLIPFPLRCAPLNGEGGEP